MSWLFSQALVEAFSADICSDGEPSAPSNGSPIQLAFCAPDKMTEFSRLSRFGMTCRPLMESLGAELLTSYLEAFPARTFPAPERVRESTEPDQVCGNTWQELSVKYDPATHSWRTHACLWDEALQWSSVILPKWGMTRSGALFQHPTAARPISGIGSGCSLPTPSASHCETRPAKTWNPKSQSGRSLGCMAATGMWPTPRSCSAMAATITPENSWAENRFPNLETIVGRHTWPTPCASDNRDRGNRGSGAIQRRVEKGKQIMLSQSVSDISGALNPQWVEWLMGWPLGWTDLKPLVMDKSRSAPQQHSESSVASEAA